MKLVPTLKHIFKTYFPKAIVNGWYSRQEQRKFAPVHAAVVAYLEQMKQEGKLDASQQEVLNYLHNHPITPIPYPFADKYEKQPVAIFTDKEKKLKYIIFEGKRLYFHAGMTNYDIKRAVTALYIEQDAASPHRYLTDDFQIPENCVFVDVGAAEGNLSLQVVEKAKKVYVIEANPDWHAALTATFEPWKDKVEIICKYASDKNGGDEINIDSIFEKEQRIDFIKIDVEGAEEKVINGAMNTIKSAKNELQVALCTYHKAGDDEKFARMLQSLNFQISFSEGYLIFLYSEVPLKPPYLRKSLIRAKLTQPHLKS